jgi:uncharacterized surface protein with fasciclin (FAS1) repeats
MTNVHHTRVIRKGRPVNITRALLTTSLLLGSTTLALAQMSGMSSMAPDPMVGGAAMYPTKNIVANAVNSKDHTTLVAAVKAAGLVPTLEGPGPFTVFAPTNEAFDALPAGTVSTLLKPENKPTLTKILTYHVVSGKYDTSELMALIAKGNGTATLPTVAGPDLTFTQSGTDIDVHDTSGDVAVITIPNVNQSNGVIQVVDKVLLPK